MSQFILTLLCALSPSPRGDKGGLSRQVPSQLIDAAADRQRDRLSNESTERHPRHWIVAGIAGLATVFVCCAAAAKVETWRQEGPSAFAKARREGVVISDNGRVRLGHSVSP